MGLEYNVGKLGRLADRLTNSQKAYKRSLINDMTKLAVTAQRLARALAPYETGSLENSIYARVNRSDLASLSIELVVMKDRDRVGSLNGGRRYTGDAKVGDYAEYMESGRYSLGARSRLKQGGSALSRKVGRRFMDRTAEFIRNEMRRIIADSAQKAGFGRRR